MQTGRRGGGRGGLCALGLLGCQWGGFHVWCWLCLLFVLLTRTLWSTDSKSLMLMRTGAAKLLGSVGT